MVFNKKNKIVEEVQEPEEVEEQEETPTVEESIEDESKKDKPKEVTVNDILVDHEQRLVRMESKWFKLGGL